MPTEKCITVYKFDELSEDAKEKAREWWREGGLNYEWYDSVEDDFKTIGKCLGINVTKIYFSGFSSQGDGACFEGSFSYEKGGVKKLMEYAPQDKELHRIAKELQQAQRVNFYQVYGTVKHRGHYYHKYETEFDLSRNDGESIANEEYFIELMRDLMDWLYHILEKEYEYLNSDEQVDETIMANEYGFTKEGKRSMVI